MSGRAKEYQSNRKWRASMKKAWLESENGSYRRREPGRRKKTGNIERRDTLGRSLRG